MFDKEPDFINEQGVKWWKENGVLDKHAQEALGEKASVWIVQTPEQAEHNIGEYLLLEREEILDHTPSMEGMAYKIDFEALRRRPS